jgi:hypothetical protein
MITTGKYNHTQIKLQNVGTQMYILQQNIPKNQKEKQNKHKKIDL